MTTTWTTLRSALNGMATVLLPDDAGFADARRLRLGGVDHRPAAIVRPHGTEGVVRAVHHAAEHGLELAVLSGGHSMRGLGQADGALVIDVRGLDQVSVDPATRTASAGGGVSAGAFTAAAAAHGLAAPFGDTGSVGIAGITLGGGVGFLSRRLGMTVDSVRSAELVTADGTVRSVSADEHPDLFWALRGGGPGLGVVTRLTYDLHELEAVVGGVLMLPATPASVSGVVGALADAPRELTAIVMVMVAPPAPFVPPEVHGRLVAMVHLCWSGRPDDAEAAVVPLRAVADQAGGLLVDDLALEAYGALLEGPEGPPMAMRMRSFFADGLSEPVAARLLAMLEAGTAEMRAVQLRVLGGAVADVEGSATAFAHRDALVTGVAVAGAPTAAAVAAHADWVRELADVVRASRDGAYVNFVPDGDPGLLAEAFPGATGQRLAQIRAEHDPANLFRGRLDTAPA